MVLKDTTLIIFTKPEVIPEVWPNPSPSLNDVQNMINSALEMRAKSIDKLMRKLIEEWDGEKHSDANVNHFSSTYTINFTQTNSRTSGPLTADTTIMGGGPNVTRCGPSHTLARSKTHNSSTIAILFDTVLHCLSHPHCCFVLRHWFTMSNPSA
jgi:hypothetical protein